MRVFFLLSAISWVLFCIQGVTSHGDHPLSRIAIHKAVSAVDNNAYIKVSPSVLGLNVSFSCVLGYILCTVWFPGVEFMIIFLQNPYLRMNDLKLRWEKLHSVSPAGTKWRMGYCGFFCSKSISWWLDWGIFSSKFQVTEIGSICTKSHSALLG